MAARYCVLCGSGWRVDENDHKNAKQARQQNEQQQLLGYQEATNDRVV